MAKYLSFKHVPEPPSEILRKKVETAPFDHAAALLKAYSLLDTAAKHGLLDVLSGAISAEDKIIEKVATYANTPEGIHTIRNLMVLGKLIGSLDPDVLKQGTADLTESIVAEVKKPPPGFFGTVRRFFHGDVLRGLAISLSALESVGRVARERSPKLGGGG